MTIPRERSRDIDGLRAIAVLSVMIFHMNPHWLPGGFVGVDVFFVISAYLITRIIYDQLSEQSFSLIAFYSRRIKRIFPMSAIVLITTALIASQTNTFLLASSKYIPLLTYNMHVVGYFTADAQKNYFLHYWSLVIEEQFYLIWPAAIMGCALVARWTGCISLRTAILCLSLTVAIAGVVYGELQLRDPLTVSQAYFLSIPRFGELALGAVVAMIQEDFRFSERVNRTIGAVGLAGIAISVWILQEGLYPGLRSLAPAISTALLLFALQRDGARSLASQMLSAPPLPAIGRMSYSLYLWHWPVLSIARFIEGKNDLTSSVLLACSVMIAALSSVSYRFVERPCIQSTVPPTRVFGAFFATSASLLAFVVAFAGIAEYGVSPLIGGEFANVTVDGQNAHLTEGWIAPCWDKRLQSSDKASVDAACGFGAPSGPRILLVGDSHAAALGRFINIVAKHENFSVTSVQIGACQVSEWRLAARAPAFVVTRERAENCGQMLDYIKRNHQAYDAIFVANAFNLFSGNYDIFTGTEAAPPEFDVSTLRTIAGATPLVFFYDGPVIDRSIQYSPILNWLGLSIGATPIKGGETGNSVVKAFAEQLPNSRWVDFSTEYSVFKADHFLHDGRPIYVDTSHLNGRGAEVLAKMFFAQNGCLSCEFRKEHNASAD